MLVGMGTPYGCALPGRGSRPRPNGSAEWAALAAPPFGQFTEFNGLGHHHGYLKRAE